MESSEVARRRVRADLKRLKSALDFSRWNVDYPYIGPWTVSRFNNRNLRNNESFFKAAQLAKAIARSQLGHTHPARLPAVWPGWPRR